MIKAKESDADDYTIICENITKDIESLKDKFPQLSEFNVASNLDRNSCKIQYEYKCHIANHGGGWTSGVPNPEADGAWFYIGLWDENDPEESSHQIHTQPFRPVWHIQEKRVTYLILEGENTEKMNPYILDILKRHGLKSAD